MKKTKILERHNKLLDSGEPIKRKICISIPLTGVVRAEWMLARYGQIIPVNWSNAELIQWIDTFSPLSYAVDDARNIAVDHAVKTDFEWLLFIDHDVIIANDTFVRLNEYIASGDYPVVAGVYNAKGVPPEPLLFRGRGNSWYRKWKYGEKVWVDGVPMGCTLISMKLLKPMYEASEEYKVRDLPLRRVFFTPRQVTFDPITGAYNSKGGTEDLWWCDRVLNEGWLKKTGFKKVVGKQFPFLVDTAIKCGHIDNDGRIF